MAEGTEVSAKEKRIDWLVELEKYALILAWIALILVFAFVAPSSFLQWPTFSSIIFGSQAVLVVLTLGLIIPLTAGDFDVSVAAVLTFSAMILAVLNAKMGLPLWQAVLACLAMGLIVGFLNAFFIIFFRIHSLIVTLGTASVIQGLILWISSSQTLSGVSPGLIDWVIVNRLFDIPLAFYYAMALGVIIWYVFEYTPIGRRLLFVGRGREVARLSGISVVRVRGVALVASSVIATLAGIINVGTTGGADPLSGLTFLLPAFAAAFLGATSIVPGRFNPLGSIIAVFFLVTGITGLNFLGVDTFVQNMFNGAALILAVSLSQLVRGRKEQGLT
ncbi:MAG: ABC transporter permease [Rhodospirillales bacterium]|nr:ABC transporter permease [Rhodospirillales bacterium]